MSREFSLSTTKEFNTVYKRHNKVFHTKNFVFFYKDEADFKIGFVASKKVGNAVLRNRSKRLLRACVLNFKNFFNNGHYVFVAKQNMVNITFEILKNDFEFAFRKLNIR